MSVRPLCCLVDLCYARDVPRLPWLGVLIDVTIVNMLLLFELRDWYEFTLSCDFFGYLHDSCFHVDRLINLIIDKTPTNRDEERNLNKIYPIKETHTNEEFEGNLIHLVHIKETYTNKVAKWNLLIQWIHLHLNKGDNLCGKLTNVDQPLTKWFGQIIWRRVAPWWTKCNMIDRGW